MSTPADKVLKLLANSRKCFDCPVLHVRMLKAECLARHRRRPERRATRAGSIVVFNKPEDLFCQRPAKATDACKTGKKIWRQLRRKKGKKP